MRGQWVLCLVLLHLLQSLDPSSRVWSSDPGSHVLLVLHFSWELSCQTFQAAETRTLKTFWTFCQSLSSSICTQWVDETGQESTQKIKDKNNGVQRCHYQPGPGFCLASIRIIPGCFHRKQKETKAKKAFLMFNSLPTKWVIPANLKSQWQPCVLQLMLGASCLCKVLNLWWGFHWSVTSKWHECYWVQYTVRFKKLTKNCIVKRSDGLH